jgi:hypothetical protein
VIAAVPDAVQPKPISGLALLCRTSWSWLTTLH